MKKIYLLLVFCCLGFVGNATSWYTVSAGAVTTYGNWNSLPGGGGTTCSDFTVCGDTFHVTLNMSIPGGATWDVSCGSVILDAGQISKSAGVASTIKIGRSLVMYGTTQIRNGAPFTTGLLTVELRGDLYVNSAATFTGNTTFSNYINLKFMDVGGSIATPKLISWTSLGLSTGTNLFIDQTSNRKLVSNVPVPQNANTGVTINGLVDFDTYTMSSGGTDAFVINNTATIYTKHALGLDGSIQNMSSVSTSGGAHYILWGSVPQITGNNMPATFQIVSGTPGRLTISNGAGVTLSKTTNFTTSATLELDKGIFDNGSNLIMDNGSIVKVDGGDLSASPTYNALVNIIYANIYQSSTPHSTGMELLPTSPLTTIGKVTVDKIVPTATIIMASDFTANGDITIASGVLSAEDNYNVTVKGDWINNSGASGFLSGLATVYFKGAVAQHIGGSASTNFNKLHIENSSTAGVILGIDQYIYELLTLESGRLDVDDKSLYITSSVFSPISGGSMGFGGSNKNWIVDDDPAGRVRRQSTFSAEVYTFPIGDTTNYTPITIDNTGTTGYLALPEFAVHVTAVKHPNNVSSLNFLKRYWTVEANDITDPMYTATVTYIDPLDLFSGEAGMAMGEWGGALPWKKFGLANAAANTLTSGVVTDIVGEFTGINNTPPSIVAAPNKRYCYPVGSAILTATSPLGDAPLSYSWSPATGLSTTTALSTSVTTSVTTTYTITVTDGNGLTGIAMTTVTVNMTPTLTVNPFNLEYVYGTSAIGDHMACVGTDLTLIAYGPANVTAYAWAGPVAITTGGTTFIETVASVTPTAAGVYTVTLTNGIGTDPGCTSVYMTPAVTINPLPTAPTVTTIGAASEFCESTVITAIAGTGTVEFQGTTSGSTVVNPVSTPTVTATGTYYFREVDLTTGCWGPEASKTVTINPLPVEYNVFHSGGSDDYFCINGAGLSIMVDGSQVGVSYTLSLNGVPTGDVLAGTGDTLDFGLKTAVGDYTVEAKYNITSCTKDMLGIAHLDVIPLPIQFAMNGDGGYCADDPLGYNVQLTGSQAGVQYQLYYRPNPVGSPSNPIGFPSAGTGGAIDYGYFLGEGIYTVIAEEISHHCFNAMTSKDSIGIYPLPLVHTMIALDAAMCQGDGTGGFPIKLATSTTGVNYQLFENGYPVFGGSLAGGGLLNFGVYPGVTAPAGMYSYTVQATDVHGCKSDMTGEDKVLVNPKPVLHTVSGGGHYCDGNPLGLTYSIYLDATELDISYQLNNYGAPVGAPVIGDGVTGIDFGATSVPGFYTVVGTNTTTSCTVAMDLYAEIIVDQLPFVQTLTGGGHYCSGGIGVDVTLTGFEAGVNYTLYRMEDPTPTAVAMVSGVADYGNLFADGTYYVIAQNAVSLCYAADTMPGRPTVYTDSLPKIFNVGGGGAYCVSDSTAYPVYLEQSEVGINYQVVRDGSDILMPFAGVGDTLHFGSTDTAGVYTVKAENAVTGCKSNMTGSATVIANQLPLAYGVTGGGRYCQGTTPPHVGNANSELNVSYQLYRNSIPWGTPMIGSGGPLDFGPIDSPGVYTVIGTHMITACVKQMDTSVFVYIKQLPIAFTIAGGGNYCSGDTGRHIYLSGSLPGTEYQLYNGITPVGTPVAGTGFGLDFGIFTAVGTYTILGKLISDSCEINMNSSVTIGINALPGVYTVSGGDTLCAGTVTGATVNLSYSDAGFRYRLYNGTTLMGTMDGVGGMLSFDSIITTGAYTITSTNLTTACKINMNDSAHVLINPLPNVEIVTGGGAYCAGDGGKHIGLGGSTSTIIYQLYTGGVPVGAPIAGTGSAVDFGLIIPAGTYVATALNSTTGCTSNMSGNATIIINPTPTPYVVTGGGSYCQGGVGMSILLSSSHTGVSYQLFAGSTAVGTPRMGTGSVINFGPQTLDSTYTVVATDTATHCTSNMTGSAAVVIVPYAAPVVTLTSSPGTVIGVGEIATVTATVTGAGIGTPIFSWRINRNIVPGANTNTLMFAIYYDNDTVECDVTSAGMCGGIVTTKQIIINMKPVGVQQVSQLNSDIRLIPNPNKGAFSLKGTVGTSTDEELTVEVTNMLGQTVYAGKIMTKNGEVDERLQLSGNLANGMYLLNLRSEKVNTVFHFVIEQ